MEVITIGGHGWYRQILSGRVFNTQRTSQKLLNFLLNSWNHFLTTFSKNLRNVFKLSNFCPYVSIVKIYCAKFLENRQKTDSIHFPSLKQKIQHFVQYICMIKHLFSQLTFSEQSFLGLAHKYATPHKAIFHYLGILPRQEQDT